jgi:hypothetical protein
MKPFTSLFISPLPLVDAAAVDPAKFGVRAVNPRDANPTPQPSEVIAPRQETTATPATRILEGESSPTPQAPPRILAGTSSPCPIL